jgi:FkbM family methyltransferase
MVIASLVKSTFRSLGLELSRITPAKLMSRDAYYAQERLFQKRPPRLILDVGANSGQTTAKYRSLFPGAVVHAFEPGDAAFDALGHSYAADAQVRVHKLAVSDHVGVKPFYRNRDDVTNSLLPTATGAHDLIGKDTMQGVDCVQVSTTTLDAFCQSENIAEIDILKMDIQGGELMALRGAREMLAARKIRLVYSEVLFADLYQNQAHFVDIVTELRGYGYRLYGLYDLNYPQANGLAWGDAVFLSPDFA